MTRYKAMIKRKVRIGEDIEEWKGYHRGNLKEVKKYICDAIDTMVNPQNLKLSIEIER